MSEEVPEPLPGAPAPPSGGQVALRIFAAVAIAEMFAIAIRCAWGVEVVLSACSNGGRSGTGPGPGEVVLAWVSPFVVIAIAAFIAGRLGWRNVAIGLWISVGLGVLSTGVVASVALG